MTYEGKLYGKVAGKYIPLEMTASEIEALKEENEWLRKAIAELHTIHPRQVPEMLNWWNRIFREFPGITKAGKESQI